MKSKAFLEEIRKSEGLERAILKDIVVEGSRATFRLITDKSYSQGDVKYAAKVSEKYVPAGFTAEVNVMKSVPEGAAVAKFIKEYLAKKYPVVSAFSEEGDVYAEAGAGGGNFVIRVGKDEAVRFSGAEVADALSKELALRFAVCGTAKSNFAKAADTKSKRRKSPKSTFLQAGIFRSRTIFRSTGRSPRAQFILRISIPRRRTSPYAEASCIWRSARVKTEKPFLYLL